MVYQTANDVIAQKTTDDVTIVTDDVNTITDDVNIVTDDVCL